MNAGATEVQNLQSRKLLTTPSCIWLTMHRIKFELPILLLAPRDLEKSPFHGKSCYPANLNLQDWFDGFCAPEKRGRFNLVEHECCCGAHSLLRFYLCSIRVCYMSDIFLPSESAHLCTIHSQNWNFPGFFILNRRFIFQNYLEHRI